MFFFFFNDTAPPEIYPLSLHDALPILGLFGVPARPSLPEGFRYQPDVISRNAEQELLTHVRELPLDRKSTRLNSSHANISYAVFCLKKKKLVVDLYNYCPTKLLTKGDL